MHVQRLPVGNTDYALSCVVERRIEKYYPSQGLNGQRLEPEIHGVRLHCDTRSMSIRRRYFFCYSKRSILGPLRKRTRLKRKARLFGVVRLRHLPQTPRSICYFWQLPLIWAQLGCVGVGVDFAILHGIFSEAQQRSIFTRLKFWMWIPQHYEIVSQIVIPINRRLSDYRQLYVVLNGPTDSYSNLIFMCQCCKSYSRWTKLTGQVDSNDHLGTLKKWK